MATISRYLQSINIDRAQAAIWHSIFGQPMCCPVKLASELKKLVLHNHREVDEAKLFSLMSDCGLDDIQEVVSDLRNAHLINETDLDERLQIQSIHKEHDWIGRNKVKYLSLIMSEDCNFRCRYCIHFANARHECASNPLMSLEMAASCVRQYLKLIKDNGVRPAYINFGGGEPLLNWQTIRETIVYAEKICSDQNIPVRFGINTNLSLMNDDIAKFLVDHDVEVAVSLDGSKEGNDKVRLSRDLSGTYDIIMRGIESLERAGQSIDGFAMTVTEANFDNVSTRLIDWAYERKMSEVRIDVDVVGLVGIPMNTVIERLAYVRKYASTLGVSVIGFWSRPAESLGLDPRTEDVGFCGGERGESLCVSPSGDVFPCGYSNHLLCGYKDMSTVFLSDNYADLLNRRDVLQSSRCGDCSILGFCRGGCMITQEANSDNVKSLSMCELYRGMTYEILRESALG